MNASLATVHPILIRSVLVLGLLTSRLLAGGGPVKVTKPVSFAILEDYDKGADLRQVALDFQRMNELGIPVLRCSFGWDDYEPARGHYDLAWLEQFVALAAQYHLQIRPYLAYTPEWAGGSGRDGVYWNNPPERLNDWYAFVYRLSRTLSTHPNVLSYEIYNEENDTVWWEGKIPQYLETLRVGSMAAKAGNPRAQVIMGGYVFPDDDWLRPTVEGGYARYYDITAFHAYPETWSEPGVTVENYLDVQYYDYFVPHNRQLGENEPIWINELGYATAGAHTERQQANWFARAAATFLADSEIQQLGIYEIKDQVKGTDVIGDAKNYHLGLTHADRSPKLAFYTVQMLNTLLNTGTIQTADANFTISNLSGSQQQQYAHLFQRPDGQQVLLAYNKNNDATVQITFKNPGRAAYRYELDGTSSPCANFDGQKLSEVRLSKGEVAIFRIAKEDLGSRP